MVEGEGRKWEVDGLKWTGMEKMDREKDGTHPT